MPQRFYHKATVQAAIVTGLFALLAAIFLRDRGGQTQIMERSPGGTQIGGDFQINVDRRRTLTQSTAQQLLENLHRMPPQPVIISTYPGDMEAQRLAQQLIQVFMSAGWRDLMSGQSNIVPGPVVGIRIHARTRIPNGFLNSLQPLFRQFGRPTVVTGDPGLEEGRTEIFVGIPD
jgi:hypothetical protein